MTNPLFEPGHDWPNNAWLSPSGTSESIMAEGYFRAADSLVNQIMSTGKDLDFLIFPIGFLFRQAIELWLKSIIRNGNKCLDNHVDFPKTHNLSDLWKQAHTITLQILSPKARQENLYISTKTNQRITNTINNFSNTDKYSTAFRYPTDKQGSSHLPGISYINIRLLHEHMTNLNNDLMSIDAALEHELDLTQENHRVN